MLRPLFTFVFIFILSHSVFTQTYKNDWQIGVGASLVMYGSEDGKVMGDSNLFQVPRLNVTIPVYKQFSIDGAVSFNSIDNIGLMENSANYFSLDASLRYNFKTEATILPYVFVGGSAVDGDFKVTPTYNLGAGATYWFDNKWGFNTQVYYKHSPEKYSSMRSHIQGTIGLVYSFGGETIFGGSGRSSRCPTF